ncbi:DUF4145 domain-containing protein [Aurantimonas sp. NFXS3]|uniref:DUF4145 domain-containing protein n=1 Tax=Aurantimonas sp. NFXS3 TaxID=2818434 RepID=UPI003B8B84CE
MSAQATSASLLVQMEGFELNELVGDCPRCKARQVTFDVFAATPTKVEHGWMRYYEGFGVCRRCLRSTTFILKQRNYADSVHFERGFPLDARRSLDHLVEIDTYISIRDMAAEAPPEHVAPEIEKIFREGATAVAVQCWNAAGAMFRASVDLATRPLLPPEDEEGGPNRRIRRDLGLRLPWLFDNGRLPRDLEGLSHCIREDGNDGVHQGTLTKPDAEDLLDFTRALLERLYTQPERLRLAEIRRAQRRAGD